MNFFHYIKAVGTGPKGNRNLSQIEIMDAMEQILDQKAYPEQITAFLLGWRLQEESNQAMSAAFKSFDKYIKRVHIKNSVELGNPYDGKQKRPYIFPLIAKELKKFDLNIVISGDYLQPAKAGITTKDTCLNLQLENNIHFFDRATYFKELSNLTQLRQRLGLRTGLNTIEKLLNPGNSKYAITGAFHKPYVKKYIDLFGKHYKKLIIVQGEEGTAEFFGKSKYWIKENDEIIEVDINPLNFGIEYKDIWKNITIEQMKEVLLNPSNELIKLVKLNAALVLFSSNKVSSLSEGYEQLLSK
ncbi:MAG: glycosyl transferase [Bacteroidetes bacterium]|nr:glycosyl transferase [Bacteroidota bacterium]